MGEIPARNDLKNDQNHGGRGWELGECDGERLIMAGKVKISGGKKIDRFLLQK